MRHAPDDLDVVRRVKAGDRALFEVLMRRYNQRLFRAARSILRDDEEAMDVVQEAWIRAYRHLDRFAGRSSFGAWATRIAVYEAYTRFERLRRARERERPAAASTHDVLGVAGPLVLSGNGDRPPEEPEGPEAADPEADVESEVSRRELRAALERAIDRLPVEFRTVFVLRDVEGMTIAETATALEVSPQTVKTRLHRARRLLRRSLLRDLAATAKEVLAWGKERCDRVVEAVFARLGETASGHCPPRARGVPTREIRERRYVQ
jgi:RNA polymerase sigma-70 factor (ECF subfamily)